jgi:hypothetical protein
MARSLPRARHVGIHAGLGRVVGNPVNWHETAFGEMRTRGTFDKTLLPPTGLLGSQPVSVNRAGEWIIFEYIVIGAKRLWVSSLNGVSLPCCPGRVRRLRGHVQRSEGCTSSDMNMLNRLRTHIY